MGYILWMKKTCRYCGKGFTQETRGAQYCSVDCRFWSKVMAEKISECWIWNASKLRFGYGQFKIRGEKTKTASKLIWERLFGPIPPGMWVLHKCDNPSCVNPFHLYAGTPTQNNRDSVDRGRRNPQRGEDNWRAKINEDTVLNIRKMRRGGMMLREIGKELGLSKRHVGKICRKDLWAHVKGN